MKKVKSCILLLLVNIVIISCSGRKDQPFTIKKGDFRSSVIETGELQPVNSIAVIVPFIGWYYGSYFKITGMVEHGKIVKKGDSIAQIDPSAILKFILNNQTALEQENAQFEKMLVEHKNRFQSIETELLEASANFELQKLSVEKYKYETTKKQQIKQLEFEQAELNLNSLLKKKELLKIICEKEIIVQKLRISQREKDINKAHEGIKLFTIKSPGDGIFQIANTRRGRGLLKIGDEVYLGQMIAKIPNLEQMKVITTINETDIYKLKHNQDVDIRLDAYPAKVFGASLNYIGRLSRQKEQNSSLKVFDLEILVKQSDPVLKPGMTVSCEIFTSSLTDAYYVENECIMKEEGNNFIYLENGMGYEKFKIDLGPRNNKYTVIYGNLEKGRKVMPQKNYEL
jgi:HlyD family secretion protein